jgi:tyrosinase
MNAPADDELIGESSGEFVVRGARSDARLALDPVTTRRLLERLASLHAQVPPERVYLSLEDIRGTRDASILNVQLQRADSGTVDDENVFRAGSLGLYGLRRARVSDAGSAGRGLGYVLDVTAFFEDLAATGAHAIDELVVSIHSQHPAPEGSPIVIGRMRIFTRRSESVVH